MNESEIEDARIAEAAKKLKAEVHDWLSRAGLGCLHEERKSYDDFGTWKIVEISQCNEIAWRLTRSDWFHGQLNHARREMLVWSGWEPGQCP